MLKEFKIFAADVIGLDKGKVTLLAISGGRDSVAMCELFSQAKLSFAIAHCNFLLRGKESDEDEIFVKKLSLKYRVPLFLKRFDTSEFAAKNKLSVQQAARELRYSWFEEIRSNQGFDFIATAHHKDDELETFLINLVRGTGIAGLHGIFPKRGNIIRPLLFASREAIDVFVRKRKLKFREDRTNASDKYLRNKIRHKILPLFEEINPSFRKTLGEEISRLRETEKIYRYFISQEEKKVRTENRISIFKLLKCAFPETLLYEILKKYHFNSDVVSNLFQALNSESGKQFFSATHRIIKDREWLLILPFQKQFERENYFIEKETKEIFVPVKMKFSLHENSARFSIPKNNFIACLDYEKLKFPLTLRRWKKGDSFFPFGLKKRKKLSDFFTDLKLSLADKEMVWLLCSGEKIVYVCGKRIDENYKVAKQTKKIYLVRCFQ